MFQPSLFASCDPLGFDARFGGIRHRSLSAGAWLEVQRGWVRGADRLFLRLEREALWQKHQQQMYERIVDVPRLLAQGSDWPVLRQMAAVLSRRYRVPFDELTLAYYRDGSDSVAWHRDKTLRDLPMAHVCVLSLGGPRRFRLRPYQRGGESIGLTVGSGDLVVMGGSCQRTWEHQVPKVAQAAPRIAVMFRSSAEGRRGQHTPDRADLPRDPVPNVTA